MDLLTRPESRRSRRQLSALTGGLMLFGATMLALAVLAAQRQLDERMRLVFDLVCSSIVLLLAGLAWYVRGAVHRLGAALDQVEPEHARLLMIVQQIPSAVVLTGLDRRITWANAAFEQLSGYRLDEMLGRSPGALLQCERTDPATIARMRTALDAFQPVRCEVLNRHRDGTDYWLELRIEPVTDEGQPVGFLATEQDITARRLAESAVRERESILERSGRLARIGGWSLQLDSGLLTWSPQALEILDDPPRPGPTADGLLAMVDPASRDAVAAMLRGEPPQTAAWDIELAVHTHRGARRWMRLVAERAGGHGGEVSRLIGVLQDVTAQRAQQHQAARDAQVLQSALEAIDEAFVLYDPEDRLVTCNEKYRQIYATSRDLLVPGNRFEDIVRIGAERGQYAAAAGRVEAWVRERVAAHQGGDTSLVQALDDGRVLRIRERRTAGGYIVGFRIDITELVRAREAAEQAARQKSAFIATISHELRTPLQSIIGFSELGRHFAQGHAQFEPMFGDILDGGRRMLTLVNGLLDLSKFDGPVSALRLQRLALAPLLADLRHELQPICAARQIEVALPPDEACGQVDAEPFRLQQVLRNLLANALRFAPAGSTVRVAVDDQGAQGVQIGVRDHGPGIPPDELTTIFEPFVQSSRTADGSGGTGLGLAICRSIVAAHGGRIWASLPDGGGALFTVWLPVRPPGAVVHAPSAAAAAAQPAATAKPAPTPAPAEPVVP